MSFKNSFEFQNSELWLKYTQQRYLTPKEIKYRAESLGQNVAEWDKTAMQIIAARKTGSIPLFLNTIEPRFWYYPADVIHRKIAEIDGLGQSLYELINRHAAFKKDLLLDSTIEEAIRSAMYEGANTTRSQAEQLIASGNQPISKDEWMLLNNLKAMHWVHDNKDADISHETILTLHNIVTQNTLEGDDINFSGRYRDDHVQVGPHQGIKYALINDSIDDMIQITTKNPRYIHPLIRAILIHYFTAYIHPFFDGNGRTARALFYFKCMKNDLKYVELLSVSAYLKNHGKQYENAFEKVVKNEFDVTYFIDFCLDSIQSALVEVERKVSYLLRLTSLQDSHRLSANQVGLIQRMALHKFRTVSIEEYASQISKSREHARKELKHLADLELVKELKVSKKLVYQINAKYLKQHYGQEKPVAKG